MLLCVHVVVKTLNWEIDRLRQRIVLKCVLHVQHDYRSLFNQSDHCFLASSLLLPSSFLRLPFFAEEDGKEMYQNEKRACGAYRTLRAEIIVFAHSIYTFLAFILASPSSLPHLPGVPKCIISYPTPLVQLKGNTQR